MMTRAQGVAIATAVQQVRPEWDHPGIVAALEKASTLGTPAEVAAAAFRLAGNLQARTPGMLHQPGAHWSVPTQGGPTVSVIQTRCGEHPAHPALDCPECAETASADPTEGAAAVRAALREAPRYTDPAVIAARQAEHRFTPDLLGALDQVIAARQAEHRRLAAERAALRGEGA